MSKVLVVDDEKSIRLTLCAFLRLEGYEAFDASDAHEAIEIVNNNAIDVVVTDIVMPGISGVDLINDIRAVSKDIRIIVMTGEPTLETAVQSVQRGASDYLSKPFRRNDFLRIVGNAAQMKTMIDEKKRLEKQNIEYQHHLEEMVRERTDALRRATIGIVNLLSQVVEFRDPYTSGHQRRVGNLAARIAEEMNLEKSTIENLRIIGYIHDIGKVAIPAEILSKPGRLTSPEIELLKSHSECGYEMVKKVDLPSYFADAVHQHHERLDGSGYPNHLKGDEISIESYILMVADVVEAMELHRPYRPSLGQESALSEIQSNRGVLYHPKVVDACLRLFDSGYKIDDKLYEVSVHL